LGDYVLVAPGRTIDALSGARLARFEGFLHGAPPRWRLTKERKKLIYIKERTDSKVKGNFIGSPQIPVCVAKQLGIHHILLMY
jgi:hypothetical protein